MNVRNERSKQKRRGKKINPYLAPLATLLTQDICLRGYFGQTKVLGKSHLPSSGPLILAPVHRARWDSILLSYFTGRRATGRDCRFMVTHNEMTGIQGWFLNQLGCFPIDQDRPSLTSLRLVIDLLADHEQLVMFPEGRISRVDHSIKLYTGIARLALMAQRVGIPVQIVPVGIGYSHPFPLPHDQAAICFGPPISLSSKGNDAVTEINANLIDSLHSAELAARLAVGRPYQKDLT